LRLIDGCGFVDREHGDRGSQANCPGDVEGGQIGGVDATGQPRTPGCHCSADLMAEKDPAKDDGGVGPKFLGGELDRGWNRRQPIQAIKQGEEAQLVEAEIRVG
jgi:hypothetical protein